MNKVGQIYPTCVTLAKTQVKEMVKQGRILVAVWHHNASGRPMANNYLDNRILNPIMTWEFILRYMDISIIAE